MGISENGGNSVVRFGLFEADLQTGELHRNGTKVRLQEQPFQILTLLLQKPGEVVTREELQSSLWPADTFVDFEHGLNAAIKRLRSALGDSAENPRFIETFARRGYRFIAPVESRPQPPSATISNSRNYGLLLAAAAVLAFGISAGWLAARKSAAALRPAERRLTGNPQNEPVWSAALSPDGKYLAFTDKAGFFLRVVGSGETHAIDQPDDLQTHNITWFPDGARVLATRGKWPDRKLGLWSVSVLGGAFHKLSEDAEYGAISPDGTHIAFVRGDYDRQELWIVDADGDHPRKLIPAQGGDYGSLLWSRDSGRLLFLHYIYHPAFDDDGVSIETCDPATGQTTVILNNSRLWNALALTADNRLIYSLGEPAPNRTDSNLWAQKIDPRTYKPVGEPVRLTSGPDGKARVDLSADSKRLSYLRTAYSPQAYIAEVSREHGHLGGLQRLHLDERRNYPYDWTRDGKSILFTWDRDGSFHLFKQALDQPVPDLLVGGDNNVFIARLDPTGTAVLYLLSSTLNDLSGTIRLMSLPLLGGTPQLVLAEPGINNFQCARMRSNVCIFSQFSTDRLAFYTFDPVTGKHALMKTIQDPEWFLQNWTLSPDGTTLALAKKHRGATNADIQILRVDGASEHTLNLDGWFAISYIDWAADGRSLWVNAASTGGTPTLLNVTLNGKITPSLQEPDMVLG
jgi:DNA-binding winged helix-turn-helix (wHTH) protein/Tol biopolymer transport system component